MLTVKVNAKLIFSKSSFKVFCIAFQILHYYLVDDTMEIREVHEPNDGRDPFPVLIRRQKMPKERGNLKCKSLDFVLQLFFVSF